MRAALVLAALAVTLSAAGAQSFREQRWFFEGRSYYDPRQVWDIDLGVELPIAGWESSGGTGGDRVPGGAFGVGIWIPIDFHMIEDFVDDSNPIVNTDYRFGGMVKTQYGIAEQRAPSRRCS